MRRLTLGLVILSATAHTLAAQSTLSAARQGGVAGPCLSACVLGDCTGDGFTDIDDVERIVENYGCGACARCDGDLTGDGAVGQLDLGFCLADYCCGYTEFGCVEFDPPPQTQLNVTEGMPIRLFITAVGDAGPIELRQVGLPTPPGGVFDPGIPGNPVTGVFSWTPQIGDAGDYTLFVSARHMLIGTCCPALTSVLIHVAAAPPPPAAPTDLRILPDYSDTRAAVLFFEDKSNNEVNFEIERKDNSGDFALVNAPGANNEGVESTVEWTDTPLNSGAAYTYRVRAVNANGNSAYTNEVVIDFAQTWPTPEAEVDIEILHGFGDGLGIPANPPNSGERMHHGIDIQGGAGGQDVRTARTALAFALVGAGDNRGVWLMYLQDGEIWFWHANHLDQLEANVAGVAYGTFRTYRTIPSGAKIGRLTQTTWTNPWNHTHIQLNHKSVTGVGTLTARLKNLANYQYDEDRFRHGLSIYASEGWRDPKKKKPAPRDEDANGRTIEFNKASDGTDFGYHHVTQPLSGDIDVALELYDEMGTNPAQTIDTLKWWIAPPKGVDPAKHGVRSSTKPYVLVAFSQNYMRDTNWDTIYDKNRETNPANYPWTAGDSGNRHHYIITNSKSDDGLPASLDSGQYWRTKAKQDNSSVEADTANMTGAPEAAKASEARFPDGEYTVWARLADLVNTSEEHKWETIRVDNYPPAVKVIELGNEDGDPLEPGECPSSLRIIFSEPVIYDATLITLSDPNQSVGLNFTNDPDDPSAVIAGFESPLQPLVKYTLTISKDVKDKSDKKLDSIFDSPNHNGTGGEAGDTVTYEFCNCFVSDLDGDDEVGQADLGILLGNWGCDDGPGLCVGDVDGDGVTGQSDLGLLLSDFGRVCR